MRRILLYTLLSALTILLAGAAPLQTQQGPDAPDTIHLASGSAYRFVVYESFLRPVT
ncbi:hypothetical protein ACFLZW_02085 [Chloroflexota bacterium]